MRRTPNGKPDDEAANLAGLDEAELRAAGLAGLDEAELRAAGLAGLDEAELRAAGLAGLDEAATNRGSSSRGGSISHQVGSPPHGSSRAQKFSGDGRFDSKSGNPKIIKQIKRAADDLFEQWPRGGFGPIVAMCGLGDRIDALAKQGNVAALQTLIDIRPRNLPAGVRKLYRNRAFCEIAGWLRVRVPGITDYRIARMIEGAGSRLSAIPPRALTTIAMFDLLGPDEVGQLESEIIEQLDWLNADEWPKWRQIVDIIGLQF